MLIGAFMPGFGGSLLATLLSTCIAMLVTGPVVGGYFVMLGKASTGVAPEVSDVFYPLRSGRLSDFVLVGAVPRAAGLLGIIPFVGALLASVVGLVLTFLFSFSMVLVAKGADWKTSLIRSKDLVVANLVPTLLLLLTAFVLTLGGALCLLVGLLVAIPVVGLLYVDVYLALDSAGPQATQPQGVHPHAAQPQDQADQYGYPGS